MPTGAGPERYEIRIEIRPEDIDVMGHVNNVVYLRWVQDAAVLGDEVVARTWVGPATRLGFDRLTELLRASDGKLLASARTVWCPIDAKGL